MSDNDKNTCPVCFTRMRTVNKVLTCPECGYKYCDHSRDLQDMFNTTHTHAPNYTTYSNNKTSTQSAQNSHSPNRQTGSKTSAKKVVKIIVIIYLIIFFCPFICSALGMLLTAGLSLFSKGGSAEHTTPEIEISSDLPIEATDSIDIDALLADIDTGAPVSIEYEDGEFVTELIKHIFNVSDCTDVTAEQLGTLYWLEIYCDSSDCLYAYYYFNDGNAGSFVSDTTELCTTNLNAFANLELLFSPNIKYTAGDLKDLKHLRGLDCHNSPSSIANVVATPLQLTELHITVPQNVSSLEGLEHFTELQTLEISAQNATVVDATQISALSKLTTLTYIDAGKIADFSFLSELPNLNYLLLGTPHLADIEFVRHLPELQNFTFYSSDVTDLQPLAAVADSLTILDISYNPYLTDFSPLSELTNLEFLTMHYCKASDLAFASDLQNLVGLWMQNNEVKSLAPLKDLPYLEYLQVDGNPIEDYAGLEAICQSY